MKGRKAMPTFGASARRILCGGRRSRQEAAVLVAFALFAAQQPAIAATRSSEAAPWRLAQSDVLAATKSGPVVAASRRRARTLSAE